MEPRRDLGLGMAAEVGKLEYRALLGDSWPSMPRTVSASA